MDELTGPGATVRITRGAVWAILSIAVLAGAFIVAMGIGSIATTLASGQLDTVLVVETSLPDAASAGAATLIDGSYETATVTVSDLTPAALTVSIIARVLGLLTQVAAAAAFALLCWSLLRTAPFRRSLSLTVTLSGAIVLLGGILSTGLDVFSSWLIAEQLNAGHDGFWPISASVDPTFIVLGFGLLFVGLAFGHAVKLQRDTVGLV